MGSQKASIWTRAERFIGNRLLSGLLVLVPLAVTVFVCRLLYRMLSSVLAPVRNAFPDYLPEPLIVAASVAILIVGLYVLGTIARLVVGRRLIVLAEAILHRIPIVKTVYGTSKQLVETLTFKGEGQSFRNAVIIEFPHERMWAIAFVTGSMRFEDDGPEYYKVFVPTTPNPTSGYFEIVPKDRVTECGLSVEEVAKFVMSGGVLAPEHLQLPDLPDRGKEARS